MHPVYPGKSLLISELGRSHYSERGGRHRCNDCPAIDIRDPLLRKLVDRPDGRVHWGWSRGSKWNFNIAMVFHTDHVVLTDVTDQTEPVLVSLTRTECHFGGTRTWFECPNCNQRCAKLYFRDSSFRCRKCHGLGYRSQLVARDERPRIIAQRIRESLGGSANLALPYPMKPPKMQWKTYYRIRARGERYEACYMAGLAAWLEGLGRR